MMADVVLKNGKGNPITYEGVSQINVPGPDKTHKYKVMSSLYAYAVTQQDDGKFLVHKKLEYLPTEDFLYFGFYEEDFESFATGDSGERWIGLFVTTKSLTVGNTYETTEMY
jgi:hypothetical protein